MSRGSATCWMSTTSPFAGGGSNWSVCGKSSRCDQGFWTLPFKWHPTTTCARWPSIVSPRWAGARWGGRRPGPAEELHKLMAAVRESGARPGGEAIYRRADQACSKCHAIGGAGGQVGPDLISLGASAQIDYLVESILEPSKK